MDLVNRKYFNARRTIYTPRLELLYFAVKFLILDKNNLDKKKNFRENINIFFIYIRGESGKKSLGDSRGEWNFW